jgi:fatty-acyl-CoA synthase
VNDTVTGLIDGVAATRPNDASVLYGADEITHAELAEMGRRAAMGLRGLGVGPGDRVAFWLPNCPAYLALYLGCCRLGTIAVAVNTRYRAGEVSDILERSGAKVLAMWPGFRHIDFLGLLDGVDPAALDQLETLILYDEGEAASPPPKAVAHCRVVTADNVLDQPPLMEDAAAADIGCNIFTTSGTTSAPKFVLHGQGGIASHARTVADYFGYATSNGALLQMLPLCGVFGFVQMMAGLASGQPTVLTASFDPEAAIDLSARHNVVNFNATDDMIQGILDASEAERPLPNLRFVGSAAFATNYAELAERAEARGIRMVGLYGMSEVQALFSIQPMALPLRERILGGGAMASKAARARVRDPDSGDLLSVGQAGELELKGPSLMLEYYRNPEATAAAFTDDGFLRTGDLAEMTEDGRFIFLQRMGDVLRLGGFLVSPAEIEAHLQNHPAVDGCQVVGVRTDQGDKPVGFVIPAVGAAFDEDALHRHCLDSLARFKAPVRIFPLDEFPTTKSPNGFKIQRAALRDMAAERLLETANG